MSPVDTHSFSIINLGCRVNRVEADDMAQNLIEQGWRLVEPDQAAFVIVNTCAVTAEAETKARKTIRHTATLPHKPQLIATGCMAALFNDELKGLAPQLVVEPIKAAVPGRISELAQEMFADTEETSVSPRGSRAQTPTGRTRPGIMIQDGCDRRCSYCIVWKARGKGRSKDAAEVVRRVEQAQEAGLGEVVLTGINLGTYACPDCPSISALIELIMSATNIGRVRLSSIEPQDVSPELLELIAASNGRVAPYLHIPLQSGCDTTLERMNRAYTTAEFAKLVEGARSVLGDELSLGTDMIVGFPGETEHDHKSSLEFAREMAFSRIHVFRYSVRPATPAAEMSDQVLPEIKAQRSKELRRLAKEMRTSALQARVGKQELVLCQDETTGVTGGLYDTLIDKGSAGRLMQARVRAVTAEGLLDCRA